MGLSEFDPAARDRVSSSAGRKVGATRALKPRQIWAIRFFLDQHGRVRDRALLDLAIDSKLRGCDLVKIGISDIVCDRKIRTRATVVQQKTGRPVQFELMDDSHASRAGFQCVVGEEVQACPAAERGTGRPHHRCGPAHLHHSHKARLAQDLGRKSRSAVSGVGAGERSRRGYRGYIRRDLLKRGRVGLPQRQGAADTV